jgi:hypothetical protein
MLSLNPLRARQRWGNRGTLDDVEAARVKACRPHVGECPLHSDLKIISYGGTAVHVPGHSNRLQRQ